jgi:hypothetical protein
MVPGSFRFWVWMVQKKQFDHGGTRIGTDAGDRNLAVPAA